MKKRVVMIMALISTITISSYDVGFANSALGINSEESSINLQDNDSESEITKISFEEFSDRFMLAAFSTMLNVDVDLYGICRTNLDEAYQNSDEVFSPNNNASMMFTFTDDSKEYISEFMVYAEDATCDKQQFLYEVITSFLAFDNSEEVGINSLNRVLSVCEEAFDNGEAYYENSIIKVDNTGKYTVCTYSFNTDKSSDNKSGVEVTMGMEQALKKATDYLEITGLSYQGLLDQLEYDGFTDSEAIYAADNCGADWNEQAARKATIYLQISSFSRTKLIEQLEYDGFTKSQAEYGVQANGY